LLAVGYLPEGGVQPQRYSLRLDGCSGENGDRHLLVGAERADALSAPSLPWHRLQTSKHAGKL
jgi:hypothetical protein